MIDKTLSILGTYLGIAKRLVKFDEHINRACWLVERRKISQVRAVTFVHSGLVCTGKIIYKQSYKLYIPLVNLQLG